MRVAVRVAVPAAAAAATAVRGGRGVGVEVGGPRRVLQVVQHEHTQEARHQHQPRPLLRAAVPLLLRSMHVPLVRPMRVLALHPDRRRERMGSKLSRGGALLYARSARPAERKSQRADWVHMRRPRRPVQEPLLEPPLTSARAWKPSGITTARLVPMSSPPPNAATVFSCGSFTLIMYGRAPAISAPKNITASATVSCLRQQEWAG